MNSIKQNKLIDQIKELELNKKSLNLDLENAKGAYNFVVTTQNEVDLTSIDGIISTAKVYTGWLANSFNNLKEITGNAISMDWANSNSSFFED